MIAFDARAAKLLEPGKHLSFPEYPGLRFDASTRGRSWIYRYRSPVDGRMRQLKIGAWPEVSVSAAIVAWEGLKQRRDAGEDISVQRWVERAADKAENERRNRAQTVGDVCAKYLVEHIEQKRKPDGVKNVKSIFANLIPADFAALDAEAITRTHAFDLISAASVRAPVQAKYLRQELGAAWDHALDAGRLKDTTPNWWRLILRGKIKSKGKKIAGEYVGTAKRWLTDKEAAELIDWLHNFSDVVEDALTLYLWTGVRGDEIVNMAGADIGEEADGWWWTVPKEKTKNARHEGATDLRVPLVGRAREIVRRRMSRYGSGWLFPKKKKGEPKPMDQSTIQTAVYYHQPYSQTRPDYKRPRLTVTHWAPHDLRRTVRTCLARMRCPDDVAEAIVGHMQEGIKGVYNLHTYDAERREWLTKLADRWESMAQSKLPYSVAGEDRTPGRPQPTP